MTETAQFVDEFVDEANVTVILKEYHKHQLVENLTGPSVSFVFHLVMLMLMFIFIITAPKSVVDDVVVNVVQLEEIDLEPEQIEELTEVEVDQDIPQPEVAVPSEVPTSIADALTDVSEDAPQTDDSMDAEEVCDVVRTDSVLKYSGSLGGRTAAGRKRLGDKYGASGAGQERVSRALRWLAKVQNADGSWGNNSPAHTGMALLVFLAHGETPVSETYGTTVQKAMQWLVNYSADTKTMSSGVNAQKAYGHGIATYAIAESYAMTKIPFLQVAMERCVDVIVKGQQPGGGFDYSYKKGDRWDLSVGGWQFQALKAAKVAGSTNEGLKHAIEASVSFCRHAAYAGGKFGYTSAGSGGNMTGVGAVALQLLGQGKLPEVGKAMETIAGERFESYKKVAEKPQDWTEVSEKNLYGWYYDTQAMFNAAEQRGMKQQWKSWREVFEKVLIRSQNPEGYWETKGHIGGADIPGRVLATCFSCLQLEVYYRYLPTFDINKMDASVDAGPDINQVGTGVGIEIEKNL